MTHVRHLASPALRGRAACTADEQVAGDYVVSMLDKARVLGLPRGSSAQRRHGFDVSSGGKSGACKSSNVLGLVGPRGVAAGSPDGGSTRAPLVVVGAHYDHLGVRHGAIHPGAEDNASGVAVALEVAASLQRRQIGLRHGVLFVFFGAEERGMLGSRAFVRESVVALDRIVAMVNIDMIGRRMVDQSGFGLLKAAWRIDDFRAVGIVGTKLFPALRSIVDTACEQANIRAYAPGDFPEIIAKVIEKQTRGRGDNWPFAQAGVPTVFFSSGESDDYHMPSDVVETLEPELLRRRAEAIYRTVVALANADPARMRKSSASPAPKQK